MTADVRGIGTVLITEKGCDLLEAISNAAGRLGILIRRSIDRRRRSTAPNRRKTIRGAE